MSVLDTSRMRPGVVHVDPRVGSKEFARPLNRDHGLKVRCDETLPAGDFAFCCGHTVRNPLCDGDFGCRITIERKTVSDLVGSLLKNRLGGLQVPDMLVHYDVSWILVEGIWRPGHDDAIEIWARGGWKPARYGITYSALSSWLVRYDVMGGGRIKRWRTSSVSESAAFIASVFRWWSKEWKDHAVNAVEKMPPPIKAMLWKANDFEKMAASKPGIGYKHMRKATRYFHSDHELANASVKDLMNAGFGRALALKVYSAIRREYR